MSDNSGMRRGAYSGVVDPVHPLQLNVQRSHLLSTVTSPPRLPIPMPLNIFFVFFLLPHFKVAGFLLPFFRAPLAIGAPPLVETEVRHSTSVP